jgi:hypothetical protein
LHARLRAAPLPGETLVFGVQANACSQAHLRSALQHCAQQPHRFGRRRPWSQPRFLCEARLGSARTATATPSPGAAARRGSISVPLRGADRAACGLRSRLQGASRQQSCQILPRYFKARRGEPAFVERRSCAVSAGNRCGASRCWGRAAPGVVCQGARCRPGPHGEEAACGVYPSCWCGTATPH